MQLAAPQKKSFIQIEGPLFDAVMGSGLTGRQTLVLLGVIRMTIGQQKRCELISNAQLGELVHIACNHVATVLCQLRRMGVIFKDKERYRSFLEVNLNLAEWRTPIKPLPLKGHMLQEQKAHPVGELDLSRQSNRFAERNIPARHRNPCISENKASAQNVSGQSETVQDDKTGNAYGEYLTASKGCDFSRQHNPQSEKSVLPGNANGKNELIKEVV